MSNVLIDESQDDDQGLVMGEPERVRDRSRVSDRDRAFFERIIHDEEFGEENVEQVDAEWEDFEKILR